MTGGVGCVRVRVKNGEATGFEGGIEQWSFEQGHGGGIA